MESNEEISGNHGFDQNGDFAIDIAMKFWGAQVETPPGTRRRGLLEGLKREEDSVCVDLTIKLYTAEKLQFVAIS